jgi:hypothetical protein
MAAPLIPQEIYLLERYSSLEYFGRMRDAFAACVKAAEDALADFMKHLPADYRSQPLHMQPGRVWGERVIPNMQWAREGLNNGYIRISHGDLDALGMAGNVSTTFAGIGRDYSSDWMPPPFYDEFDRQWSNASEPASNIDFTALAQWRAGALTTRYTDSSRGPLDPPPSWPQYRLNLNVRVKTNEEVPQDGIYLPDVGDACAQLLIKGYEAWGALVPRGPTDPEIPLTVRRPTVWTLVERIADSGGGIPGADNFNVTGVRLRCEANHPCPREGYWFTPAKAGSRRHFKQGEIMPSLDTDYGLTIWQWAEQQAN